MLDVENLRKSFRDVHAVNGVSFQVHPGEIYGLLGPNGAGKTTTISMVSGLLRPDSGRAAVGGVDVSAEPEKAKAMMGVVPQETALYEELPARDNVAFWGRLYGLEGAELKRRVDEVLDLVGLASSDRRGVKKFSGGMKRRLNLAMGLVHRPRLLLLDEPTVGIDPQGRIAVLDVVRHVAAEGAAVLYTTHYLEEAETLCRRVGIIDHGKILAEGTVPELRALVGEGAVASFRGSFTAAALEASLRRLEGVKILSLEDGSAMISLAGERGGVTRVLGEIFRNDIPVEGVSIREPNLESVFIKLTGRELRD